MNEPFITNGRINSTPHVPSDHQRLLPAANKAGNASSDFIFVARFCLVGPVGISYQLAAEANHVRFAFCKDFLAMVGIS
jgi:hypothetical protein